MYELNVSSVRCLPERSSGSSSRLGLYTNSSTPLTSAVDMHAAVTTHDGNTKKSTTRTADSTTHTSAKADVTKHSVTYILHVEYGGTPNPSCHISAHPEYGHWPWPHLTITLTPPDPNLNET